jgi:NitT/TauT family transport system substrate-binding protein
MLAKGFIGIVAAFLVAWGIGDAATAAQAPEKKNVTIAVSGPPAQLYFLPVVLAKQLGYFEKAGIDVQLQHFNAGSKAIESVIGGSADVVAGAYENAIRLQAKGQAMKSIVLFGRYPENVLGIAKSQAANYRGPQDLKGKLVGITGPGSATQTFLNLILEKAGLSPSDVTPVTVGAGAVAVAAMRRQKELFAVANLDLAITELTMSGDILVVIDSRTAKGTQDVYGDDYASGSLYAPADFVAKNPNTAQALADAMVRTLKWMAASTPDDIVSKLPQEFYQANPVVYRQALEKNLPSFSRDGLLSEEAAKSVYKTMIKLDPSLSKSNINVGSTYQNTFVQHALQTPQ